MFEYFVVFVKNKVFDFVCVEFFVMDEGYGLVRGINNDVRVFFFVGKDFLVGRDGSIIVEDISLDIGYKFGKMSKFIFDLIGKFLSVIENDDRNFVINGFIMDN